MSSLSDHNGRRHNFSRMANICTGRPELNQARVREAAHNSPRMYATINSVIAVVYILSALLSSQGCYGLIDAVVA